MWYNLRFGVIMTFSKGYRHFKKPADNCSHLESESISSGWWNNDSGLLNNPFKEAGVERVWVLTVQPVTGLFHAEIMCNITWLGLNSAYSHVTQCRLWGVPFQTSRCPQILNKIVPRARDPPQHQRLSHLHCEQDFLSEKPINGRHLYGAHHGNLHTQHF